MITLLPEPGTYGAAVVTGLVNTAAEQMRGVVVLKATYDLTGDGTVPRRPVLAPGKGPHEIRMTDAGLPIIVQNAVVDFTLHAEADVALEKARTDIVVEGWVTFGHGGTVRVNGALWLSRSAIAPLLGDANDHLFGWHGRGEDGRALTDDAWQKTPPADLLPPQYTPLFNNFYRRSLGFQAPGNTVPLPSGAGVAIHKREDETDAAYAFNLPTDRFTARVRTFCGDCPDKPNRWCIAESFALSPDTLIVKPAANRATVIWRGGWDWARHPVDSYRAVEILREEA
jgi:hypothetical protein